MRRGLRSVLAALVLCPVAALVPASAAAQGSPRGHAFGQAKSGRTGAPGGGQAGSSAAPVDGTGVRNFGSWLDDASVMQPGAGFMSFAVGYWRMPGMTEVDVPAFDVGLGLTSRVQLGASVPVYHASAPGLPPARGVGDMYLTSKVQLRDPATSRSHVGFAIVPALEVLSAPLDGTSRLAWALPASVEVQRRGWRVYGTGGYFSRGSVFASGALELSVRDRVWVTGSLSQAVSVKHDALSDAMGIPAVRTDLAGGVAAPLSDAISVFGSVGRTLSTEDPSRALLSLTTGIAVNFAAWHH
jgi:hypothetical protein